MNKMRTQSYLDTLEDLFLAVVPEAIVDPEAEQLQRRLGAKVVHGRHVEIIQENNHFFPSHWNIHTFNPLLHSRLDDLLHVIRASLKERQKNNVIKTRTLAS